jgi:hypothetical protein
LLQLPLLEKRIPQDRQIPQDCAIDSTGIKIKGPGEYLADKHSPTTRKEYAKLHIIGQHNSHEILTQTVTRGVSSDSPQLPILLPKAIVHQNIHYLYGDKGYGSNQHYDLCFLYHMIGVFNPKKNAQSRTRGGSFHRSRMIRNYQKLGKDVWKETWAYWKRCAIEQTFAYRKQLFGKTMRAHFCPYVLELMKMRSIFQLNLIGQA